VRAKSGNDRGRFDHAMAFLTSEQRDRAATHTIPRRRSRASRPFASERIFAMALQWIADGHAMIARGRRVLTILELMSCSTGSERGGESRETATLIARGHTNHQRTPRSCDEEAAPPNMTS
jgi:hypothetical protein